MNGDHDAQSLPPTWVKAILPQISDNLDSRRIPINAEERSLRQGEIPYYGATGQVGWIDDFLFDEPIVLLGEDGAPFLDATKPKAYFVEGKSWVNNHAHVIRAKQGTTTTHYLTYALNTLDYQGVVTGTTRLKLTQQAMNTLAIPLAPLPEQRRIVAELEKQFTRLDAAVAALKRAQANLKRYRASVLKAACEGRLVPTEAELARKEGRAYEPASVLLERILKERRTRWEVQQTTKRGGKAALPGIGSGKYKDPQPPDISNLPELPEGWAWATPSQISDASLGKMLDQKRVEGQHRPYLRNLNIRWNSFDLSDLLTMPFKANEIERYSVQPGDVLICEGGEPGRAAVWPYGNEPVQYQKALHRLRLYGLVEPKWLVFCLWSDAQSLKLESHFTGSTIKHFTGESLEKYRLPLPALPEQRRIVIEIERRLSAVDMLDATVQANLKRAERLRQAILKRAFEGKLVPQDPNDEPASELLGRIRQEREQAEAQTARMKVKRG